MRNELQPSVRNYLRLSVWLAFYDVKTACAVGVIRVLTDVFYLLSLTLQGIHAIFDLRSSKATHTSAKSEKNDAMPCVTVAEPERNDTFEPCDCIEFFFDSQES